MELLQKEKNMKILVDFRNPLPFRRLSAKPLSKQAPVDSRLAL
jgi:hypothetical protein